MGTAVTLTANAAPSGQVFDKWEVVSGSITLADANSATTTFTMPAGDVSVTATYKAAPVTLSGIAITTTPTKTTYTAGESFNKTGMVVTATYSDGSTAAVTDYTVSPSAALTTSDDSVTISYTEGDVTKTATQAITVNPAVSTYTITFDAKGGTGAPANATTGADGKLSTLPTPTRSGYTFNGWYSAESGGTKVDTNYAFTANTTLYAQWTYTGSSSSSGSSYTPTTYKVESTVSKEADGAVSLSRKSAKKGDTVTITVTPDRYYKVSGVTVKDKNGKEIAVTDNGDGTFTFQMPSSKVSVEPTFSWDNPFVDVAEDTYYAPAVEWALKHEITGGTTTATFSPNTECTRAQIVTFLWRAAGSPEPAGMSGVSDVSADAYYAKAVAWAVEQGITGGTGDGRFSPDAVCTRSQSMTLLYRGEQAKGGGMKGAWMFLNPFTDVDLGDYYGEAVMWAVANGVTSGTSETTFSPDAICTRGQIVTFLYRAFVK